MDGPTKRRYTRFDMTQDGRFSGFYWLRDKEPRKMNPFVAYWHAGGWWEFPGTDFTFDDDEEVNEGEGVAFKDRFTIVAKAAILPTRDELFHLLCDHVDCEGGGLMNAASEIVEKLEKQLQYSEPTA